MLEATKHKAFHLVLVKREFLVCFFSKLLAWVFSKHSTSSSQGLFEGNKPWTLLCMARSETMLESTVVPCNARTQLLLAVGVQNVKISPPCFLGWQHMWKKWASQWDWEGRLDLFFPNSYRWETKPMCRTEQNCFCSPSGENSSTFFSQWRLTVAALPHSFISHSYMYFIICFMIDVCWAFPSQNPAYLKVLR